MTLQSLFEGINGMNTEIAFRESDNPLKRYFVDNPGNLIHCRNGYTF